MNTNAKKILKISSVTLLFIFIVIYAISTSKDLIFGIKIKDVNLVDRAKMSENIIEVTGSAKKCSASFSKWTGNIHRSGKKFQGDNYPASRI